MGLDPVAAEITPSPIVVKQDKAAPELTATARAIDKEQRASSFAGDLMAGTVALNVEEGEEKAGSWIRVGGLQVTVSLDDFCAALANKSKANVKQAIADFVLAKGTEEPAP